MERVTLWYGDTLAGAFETSHPATRELVCKYLDIKKQQRPRKKPVYNAAFNEVVNHWPTQPPTESFKCGELDIEILDSRHPLRTRKNPQTDHSTVLDH